MPVLAAARIDHRAAPAVAVVPVALQRCHAQPVAEVELVALPVLDRQVALHVVARLEVVPATADQVADRGHAPVCITAGLQSSAPVSGLRAGSIVFVADVVLPDASTVFS